MKHPLTLWLGGDSTIVIHRPLMRVLKELSAPRPMEMAALLEHLTFLHRLQQVEWVTLPYGDIEQELMIEERTARNYFKFFKDHGLVASRRNLMEYKGQISPFLQYQVQPGKLAQVLGMGGAENFSGSVVTSFSGSSSISQTNKKKEKKIPSNEYFDALAMGIYGRTTELVDAKQVAIVANELKAAGWTPELITSVLSAVTSNKFWKTVTLTPFTVRKNAEGWRKRFADAIKGDTPRVVTSPTTPDDDNGFDFTQFDPELQ